MSDPFPEGPKAPEPIVHKTPDVERSAARAAATTAVVVALLAATVASFLFLTGGEEPAKAKPAPSPEPTVSVAPAAPSSPCAHETFAVGSCANLVLANVAQNAGLPTQAALRELCRMKDDPARQEEVIQAWIESGAHPDDARAVLFYILEACPS